MRILRAMLRVAVPRLLLVAPMALPGIIGSVLGAVSLVETAKQPGQIFGIAETFLNDRRCIGVGRDVFVKPAVGG